MDEQWMELRLPVAADCVDDVAGELAGWGLGFELRDADTLLKSEIPAGQEIVVYLRPGELPAWESRLAKLVLRASPRSSMAPTSPTSMDGADSGDASPSGGPALSPLRRLRHEDEWRDVWKKFFVPLRVGKRFWIRPSWEKAPALPDDLVIEIDPGRAFGTGRHASTQLVLECLETLGLHPARFFDVGTGSGILAMGAALLWPEATGQAIDVDPDAVACAAENLACMGLGARVTCAVGEPASTFAAGDVADVVLANVTAPTLIALAADLMPRVAAGGRLVLSGLLVPELDAVVAAYERVGGRALSCRGQNEWAALVIARDEGGRQRGLGE